MTHIRGCGQDEEVTGISGWISERNVLNTVLIGGNLALKNWHS